MKLTKKKGLIAIVLVAAIALMGFGFAAWSSTLTIDGKVTADAKWEVVITNVEVKEGNISGATLNDSTPTVAADGKSADLGEVEFELPNGWVLYTVTVKNNGTAAANLKNYSLTATTDGTGFSVVTGLTDAANATAENVEVLESEQTCTFDVLVQENSGAAEEIKIENGTVTLTLVYEANETAATAPTPDHANANA